MFYRLLQTGKFTCMQLTLVEMKTLVNLKRKIEESLEFFVLSVANSETRFQMLVKHSWVTSKL